MVRTGPRDAPPVVLVHALGLDLTYWDRQIEVLGEQFDTVAFDLPGHGRSTGDPSVWTLETVTRTLAGVIRSLGDEAAHVVGLSLGSMIAQSLAVEEPSLIRSLTLIGSAATFTREARTFLRSLAEMTQSLGIEAAEESSMPHWFSEVTRRTRPDLLDRTAKTLGTGDPEIHAAIWRMIAGLDLEGALSRIRCPTLVLVGEEDMNTPVVASGRISGLIAGSEMVVVPGAAHMLPLEKANEVNKHLLRFLTK